MLRGDVDRLYHSLRKDHPTPPPGPFLHLDHVRSVAEYYAGMTQEERKLLLAWAKKEESGIGMIPLALSGIPFFGLLLGSRIQEPLSRLPVWVIFTLWGLAALLLVAGFYIHQRQKAYTTMHIALLEQAIKEESPQVTARPPSDPIPEAVQPEADPTPPPVPGMR